MTPNVRLHQLMLHAISLCDDGTRNEDGHVAEGGAERVVEVVRHEGVDGPMAARLANAILPIVPLPDRYVLHDASFTRAQES